MRQPSKRIAERRSTAKTRKAFRPGMAFRPRTARRMRAVAPRRTSGSKKDVQRANAQSTAETSSADREGCPKTDLSSKRRSDQKNNERLVIRASQLKTVDKNWRNRSNQQHRVTVWKRQLASPPPEEGDKRQAQKGRSKMHPQNQGARGSERAKSSEQDGTLRRARRQGGPSVLWYAA